MATLYIVATPIGNLKDITLRALEVLAEVDIVAAEDTRVAQKLFNAHGITTALTSYHQYNVEHRDQTLLSELKQGKNIALISDAGTPLISDPGHSIVLLCRQNQIDVVPIPGACAAISAVSVNNFNITRYFFEGFLPPKRNSRTQRLRQLCLYPHAILFYEAKHRIQSMLEDMLQVFGPKRHVMIAREMTKIHEQFFSGTLKEALEQVKCDVIKNKGEFVIVLEGAQENQSSEIEIENMCHLFSSVCGVMSHKDAVQLACKLSDVPKNRLYEIASKYY